MSRVRFRPPPVEMSTELEWLLRAAFSAEPPRAPKTLHEAKALDLARRLGLAPILGARLSGAAAVTALPASLAEAARRARAHSAIRTAKHDRVAHRIAALAARRSIPLVFLKGFALFVCGRDRAGGRAINDLDLLAPEAGAGKVHAELVQEGYVAHDPHGNEHHLPALASPEGSKVDLHFCLRGLRFEGSGWATWQDLDKRALLTRAEGYPGECSVPKPDIQTAHLLVHGLAHHVWRPDTYPLFNLVADLQELLPDAESWRDFLGRSRKVLLRALHEPELAAMRSLALGLSDGQVPDLAVRPAGDADLLLRHILAGYLDNDYPRRLRIRHSLGRLGDAVRQGRLVHYLARRVRARR